MPEIEPGRTMREAVEELESRGVSPTAASEQLLTALEDKRVHIGSGYILRNGPYPGSYR